MMQGKRTKVDRLLRWRSSELELAKRRLAAALAEQRRVDGVVAAVQESRAGATRDAVSNGSVAGHLLHALDDFRGRMNARETAALKQQQDCRASVAAVRENVRNSSRRVECLEKLKQSEEVRHACEVARQLEAFAAEAYLSGFSRQARGTRLTKENTPLLP